MRGLPLRLISLRRLKFKLFEPKFWVIWVMMSHMSHMIWLRREVNRWHWYDWDCLTETPGPKLARIWLRRPNKFVLPFRFYTLETATRWKTTMKILGRLSHISLRYISRLTQIGLTVTQWPESFSGFWNQSYFRSFCLFKMSIFEKLRWQKNL